MKLLFTLGLLTLASSASAQMNPAEAAAQWESAQRFARAPVLENAVAAQNFQNALIERISGQYGRPIGFKAALTNPKAQELFGVREPLLGVLLQKMLKEDGATFPLAVSARPVAEADLIVRVRDPNINNVESDLELLATLDAAIPFIEIADLLFAPDIKPDGRLLTALNAGARAGVVGKPIPLIPTQATLDRLSSFGVKLTDKSGSVLAEGSGSALLGHPIHVVRWIRDTLKNRGDRLRPGDLLSLGSLGSIVPLTNSVSLHATYTGLADESVDLRCVIAADSSGATK